MTDQAEDFSALSFEDALKRLEEIVRKLENGEVPLDESIDLYSEGDRLRRHCQQRLDAAQARIEKIVQDDKGAAVGTEAFDTD